MERINSIEKIGRIDTAKATNNILRDENIYKLTDNEISLLKRLKKAKEPKWGEDIRDFIKRCIKIRELYQIDFEVKFNGAEFTVEEDDNEKSLFWKWKYNRDI